ncbi:MAG: hypothetical protein ACQER9_04890 [Nanobdellota archaeon]
MEYRNLPNSMENKLNELGIKYSLNNGQFYKTKNFVGDGNSGSIKKTEVMGLLENNHYNISDCEKDIYFTSKSQDTTKGNFLDRASTHLEDKLGITNLGIGRNDISQVLTENLNYKLSEDGTRIFEVKQGKGARYKSQEDILQEVEDFYQNSCDNSVSNKRQTKKGNTSRFIRTAAASFLLLGFMVNNNLAQPEEKNKTFKKNDRIAQVSDNKTSSPKSEKTSSERNTIPADYKGLKDLNLSNVKVVNSSKYNSLYEKNISDMKNVSSDDYKNPAEQDFEKISPIEYSDYKSLDDLDLSTTEAVNFSGYKPLSETNMSDMETILADNLKNTLEDTELVSERKTPRELKEQKSGLLAKLKEQTSKYLKQSDTRNFQTNKKNNEISSNPEHYGSALKKEFSDWTEDLKNTSDLGFSGKKTGRRLKGIMDIPGGVVDGVIGTFTGGRMGIYQDRVESTKKDNVLLGSIRSFSGGIKKSFSGVVSTSDVVGGGITKKVINDGLFKGLDTAGDLAIHTGNYLTAIPASGLQDLEQVIAKNKGETTKNTYDTFSAAMHFSGDVVRHKSPMNGQFIEVETPEGTKKLDKGQLFATIESLSAYWFDYSILKNKDEGDLHQKEKEGGLGNIEGGTIISSGN